MCWGFFFSVAVFTPQMKEQEQRGARLDFFVVEVVSVDLESTESCCLSLYLVNLSILESAQHMISTPDNRT